MYVVSVELCEAIAKVRRKLRKVPKKNILFMDESSFRLNECARKTLVAPGESEKVMVEENTSYASRYDIIGFLSHQGVLPPIIYSPEERKILHTDGITGDMLNSFIEDYLARSVAALDIYPMFLLCDRSRIHNCEKMKESFENGLCFEVIDISFLPAQAAKRLSPLDNCLFADWKRRCREHYPITAANIKQIMSDEWERTPISKVEAYYKHSLFLQRADVYGDCPLPSLHHHHSSC
jgi:hypothetical protein